MANIARCVVDSADKTNLSRFFSEAPWFQRTGECPTSALRAQPDKRRAIGERWVGAVVDDTLCEHVGSLFDYIDRHYNHGDKHLPVGPQPSDQPYVSGPVRFPVDLRLYRRYEDVTRWEEFVRRHFPDREIPQRERRSVGSSMQRGAVSAARPGVSGRCIKQFRTRLHWRVNWWKRLYGTNCRRSFFRWGTHVGKVPPHELLPAGHVLHNVDIADRPETALAHSRNGWSLGCGPTGKVLSPWL